MGRGEDQRVLSRWQAEPASGRPEDKPQDPCPSVGHSSQKRSSSSPPQDHMQGKQSDWELEAGAQRWRGEGCVRLTLRDACNISNTLK